MLQTTWPQEPVASENVAVCFTQNQWASLDSARRALCRKVTRENYTDVASLVSPSPRPDLVSQLERGEAPGDPNPWEAEVLRGICPGGKSRVKTEELAVGPYECKEPGEGLRSTTLTQHQRIGMGEKPCACKGCGRLSVGAPPACSTEATHGGETKWEECWKAFGGRSLFYCPAAHPRPGETPGIFLAYDTVVKVK